MWDVHIEVSSVFEIHRQLIIDSFQIGNIGSVSADEMILNFHTQHGSILLEVNIVLYGNDYIDMCTYCS